MAEVVYNDIPMYAAFKKIVWTYYKKSGREMPWRNDPSPYGVFVSELMLQQTQVSRVLIKYPLFINTFPDFVSLSKANTAILLSTWQGMGYNRRALYLRESAGIVVTKYDHILPSDPALLDELPGIGYATACSIAAFAYNMPVSFIETNIRRVIIHHFFNERKDIADEDIMPIVEKTLDRRRPREWYWALMDYGAHLGKMADNPNKKSKHYVKQKKFEGSLRQMRGKLLKLIVDKSYSRKELENIYRDDSRLSPALRQLEKEGFIQYRKNKYRITC